MSKTFGRYNYALVSRIPDSFSSAIGLSESVNLAEARREHLDLTKILRSLGVDVIELPADESLPDSPYIEDTAAVYNGIALICRPGHPARARETDTIKAIIKKELDLPVIQIADPKATLDGGDVLFTGKEFFVGISGRTNEAGARALAAAFPEYPVTPIRVPNKLVHLKSCMSMAGPDILCISSTPEAREILKLMEREATFRYATLTVPDNGAANVTFVNGTLLYRSEFPNSCELIEKRIDFPKIPIKLWELSKAQGTLSSLALLVNKPKRSMKS
ncbi:N(G),N(G)-dimethylarginine dimethylaminohydrolase 1 [Tetranychus urticae]|uniref:Uncharacterized protein n=1 Tax=Tetranychus urticae TaxID=32264 RepID=T1KF75_TETUR|nr:N(G),N(G)-dimethylarginine dimethylaminohydrolase 1 [Tetranychus urticae]